MPLVVAFTLGAVTVEIKNLRVISVMQSTHQKDLADAASKHHAEVVDMREEIDINYLDGYRHGWFCAEQSRSGNSTSHHCATVSQPRK